MSNVVNNTILFNDTTEHQVIFFNIFNYILDKLNIIRYDKTGSNLPGYSEWTVSLIIEYDDIKNNEHTLKF